MTEQKKQNEPLSEGYERRDIDIKKTVWIAVACIAFIVVSIVILDEYFTFYKERLYYDTALVPVARDYLELQAAEDSLLNNYTRVDSLEGVYRIPIGNAMELMAGESGSE